MGSAQPAPGTGLLVVTAASPMRGADDNHLYRLLFELALNTLQLIEDCGLSRTEISTMLFTLSEIERLISRVKKSFN